MDGRGFEKLVITGVLPIKGAGAKLDKPTAPVVPSKPSSGLLRAILRSL
jgi:hypothetical protein